MKTSLMISTLLLLLFTGCSKSKDDIVVSNPIVGKWLIVEQTVPTETDGVAWVPVTSRYPFTFRSDGGLDVDSAGYNKYQLMGKDSILLESSTQPSNSKWYQYKFESMNHTDNSDLLLIDPIPSRFPVVKRLRRQ